MINEGGLTEDNKLHNVLVYYRGTSNVKRRMINSKAAKRGDRVRTLHKNNEHKPGEAQRQWTSAE